MERRLVGSVMQEPITLSQSNGEIKLEESTHKYILIGHENISSIVFKKEGKNCNDFFPEKW